MGKTKIEDIKMQDYRNWANRFNVDIEDFTVPPQLFVRDGKFEIEILKLDSGYIAIVSPKIKKHMEKIKENFDWDKNIKSMKGVPNLLEALNLSKEEYQISVASYGSSYYRNCLANIVNTLNNS